MTAPRTLAVVLLVAIGCRDDHQVAVVNGPPEGGRFGTVPAGMPLPDDAACAARVSSSTWEPRPGNDAANHHLPTAAQLGQLTPWGKNLGYDDRARVLGARVSGQFAGTSDEILQWGACKWGFADDLVRAVAVQSSRWQQSAVACWTMVMADCPPGGATRVTDAAAECATCYGILQIAWKYNNSTWPMVRDSTAFNVDYFLGIMRACFEGWVPFLGDSAPANHRYGANDAWGCLGAQFSGGWYDAPSVGYIQAIQGQLASRAWRQPTF
jgi:hypothetical protein